MFSSNSVFRLCSIACTPNGSSLILGGLSLHTGNLYPDYPVDLPPKGGIVVGGIEIGVSGLEGTIDGSADQTRGWGKGCNFGPVIFLLAHVLPFPSLGSTGGIILSGLDTDLAIAGMGLGTPSLLE